MSVRVDCAALGAFCSALLRAQGLAPAHADEVMRCLLHADLWGVDSHGVSRLPIYLERLRRGAVNPRPVLATRSGAAAVATIDGDNGPGAVVGGHAMRDALARAALHGVGVAVARRSNHYGVAGHYARMAVPAGCIGVSGTNAPITMAAWGAREPALGTNPFAVALPAGRFGTFALDMSSSVVAKGRILQARRRGTPIPEGWALDAAGRATTDAAAAWDGVVLPFAGPKGSGFALFVEALSGALAGAAMAGAIADQYTVFDRPAGVGHFFIALQIEAFMPLAEFTARMETLVSEIQGRRRADGVDRIRMPGALEAESEARLRADGIPLDAALADQLDALARDAGLATLPRR